MSYERSPPGGAAADGELNMFFFCSTYFCVVCCIAFDVKAGSGAPSRLTGWSYEGGGVPRWAARMAEEDEEMPAL